MVKQLVIHIFKNMNVQHPQVENANIANTRKRLVKVVVAAVNTVPKSLIGLSPTYKYS